MLLNIDDSDHLDSPSEVEMRKCIEGLGAEQFLVLSREEGYFIQTYHNADGSYELEFRQGSTSQQYKVDSDQISVADVCRAFDLFLMHSEELVTAWDWKQLSLGPDLRVGDDSTER